MRLTVTFRVHCEYRSGKITFDIFSVSRSTFNFRRRYDVFNNCRLYTLYVYPESIRHEPKISDALESSREFVRRPRPGEILEPIYHRVPIDDQIPLET